MLKTKLTKRDYGLVDEIHQLITNDAESELVVREMLLNVYIESICNEAEIMLRFNERVGKIVLARIFLMKQRQGGLTTILKVIEEFIAKHPNYHTIEFESVLTPEMKQYCLKNGYTEVQWVPFNYQKTISLPSETPKNNKNEKVK